MTTRRWWSPRAVGATAALAASALLGAACSTEPAEDDAGVVVGWRAGAVPAHSGAPGRTVLRDATRCGDEWWLVGAVFLDSPTETRDTRPAAWTSQDGVTWTAIPVTTHTYWGRRAILNSVACSRGRVAMVGARSGGAHGNPRVTTFRETGEGGLVDVPAVFTQYGGITATGVGPMTGGPGGWLIAGNRLSGPGVWVTDDPSGFTKVEDEPGLVGDGSVEAVAQAGAWVDGRWVLVGGGARTSSMADREPLAWTSPDGLTWSSMEVPATSEAEDLHKALELTDTAGASAVALGLSGQRFAAWVLDGSSWSRSGEFGAVAEQWSGTPYVASVAEASSGVLATLSTAARYELWFSRDTESWTPVAFPGQPSTASDHALVVAAEEDQLLLVVDDGDDARVYVGQAP